MKQFIRTMFIWMLSLSLTGLPMIVQSQSLTGLDFAENEAAVRLADEQLNDMPCHSKTTSKIAPQIAQENIAVTQKAVTNVSKDDKCCCGIDCQCHSDMNCHSVHSSSVSAILQSSVFISSPISSQLTTESIILSYDCDTDSEIIPPRA